MPPQKSVSVIIPTRNQAKFLNLCLRAFLKQTVWPKEIIVVDNNSTDETRKIILSYLSILPVNYLFEKRISPASARNKGIMGAKGKILAFIDSDCLPAKDWTEKIWVIHQQKKDVVVQGRWTNVLTDKSVASSIYFFYLERNRQLLLGKPPSERVNFIDTKNFSLPKKIIDSNHLYFDSSFTWYGEYLDFTLQVSRKNIPIVYAPQIIVQHLVEKHFLGFLKTSLEIGMGKSLLEKKWRLKEQRRKLDGFHHKLWQKQREDFISNQQKKTTKKIPLEKSFFYSLALNMGIRLGNLISYVGQQLY